LHISVRESCAVFDTRRWVANFEKGIEGAWTKRMKGMNAGEDIYVADDEPALSSSAKHEIMK
jgi:hypothetical protein